MSSEIKPDWMKVGATCYCLGEGQDLFVVQTVGEKRYEDAAFLVTADKNLAHGWESFSKLYQTLEN